MGTIIWICLVQSNQSPKQPTKKCFDAFFPFSAGLTMQVANYPDNGTREKNLIFVLWRCNLFVYNCEWMHLRWNLLWFNSFFFGKINAVNQIGDFEVEKSHIRNLQTQTHWNGFIAVKWLFDTYSKCTISKIDVVFSPLSPLLSFSHWLNTKDKIGI